MSDTIRILSFFTTLFLVTGMAFSSLLAASPKKSSEEIILQVQKKYQQLQSLEFDFSQSTLTSGRMKQGSGNAVFYRTSVQPGRSPLPQNGIMRWNYTTPTEQTIINDGKELSIYTPVDKQLIVSPVQEIESDITYAIFTGTRNLLDEFVAAPADTLFLLNEPPTGFTAVLLTPRQPHPQVKRIQLWLNNDLTIYRLLMEDHFDALTELTFTKVRFNTLPAGNAQQRRTLLELDLPSDTEIIRQ